MRRSSGTVYRVTQLRRYLTPRLIWFMPRNWNRPTSVTGGRRQEPLDVMVWNLEAWTASIPDFDPDQISQPITD